LRSSRNPLKGFLKVKRELLVVGSVDDVTVSLDYGTIDAGNLKGPTPDKVTLELTTFSLR